MQAKLKGVRLLFERDVKAMRLLGSTGLFTLDEIGEKFGVGQTTVTAILSGKRYRDFHDGTECRPAERLGHFQGANAPNSAMTPPRVRAVRKLARIGKSKTWIAKRFGITPQCVGQILSGRLWAHVR
jgi:hypothetical protein